MVSSFNLENFRGPESRPRVYGRAQEPTIQVDTHVTGQVSTIYACNFGIKMPDRGNRRCVCAAGELFLVSSVGGQQDRFECE